MFGWIIKTPPVRVRRLMSHLEAPPAPRLSCGCTHRFHQTWERRVLPLEEGEVSEQLPSRLSRSAVQPRGDDLRGRCASVTERATAAHRTDKLADA